MKFRSIAFLALLPAAVSCIMRTEAGAGMHPFVSAILQDRDGGEYRMLQATASPDPDGDVYIIGDEEHALHLADYMAICDLHDNVDGSAGPDGLPDFAGETISCIVDTSSVISGERFREAVVRCVLEAVDTVFHITPYDIEGIGHKNPAKLIILAGPQYSRLSSHDVDTLLTASGSGIRFISSLDDVFGNLAVARSGKEFSLSVVSDGGYSDYDLYEESFRNACNRAGVPDGKLTVYPALTSNPDSLMLTILDTYSDSGADEAINTFVVDDCSLDVNELKASLASLVSVTNERSVKYGKLVSQDFRMAGTVDIVTSLCYDALRKGNLFTHNIAKPQVSIYYVTPEPEGGRGLFLVPGFYVQN